jgi:PEP-CTERM motif
MRVLFLALLPALAWGDVILFYGYLPEESAWAAEAAKIGTVSPKITFEGLSRPSNFEGYLSGLTIGGVTFRGHNTHPEIELPDYLYVADPVGVGDPRIHYHMLGDDELLAGPGDVPNPWPQSMNGTDNYLETVLPAGTHAFGLQFSLVRGGDMHFDLSTGDSFTLRSLANYFNSTVSFAGFISDEPITSVRFRGARNVLLDDFSYAVTPVPEPSSFLLFGTAAALLGIAERKRCWR